MNSPSIDDALVLVQMEYREMPDLKLTLPQARRLWNLSHECCEEVLSALVASGFLARTSGESYVRGERATQIRVTKNRQGGHGEDTRRQ
jgi:hypothetical protein